MVEVQPDRQGDRGGFPWGASVERVGMWLREGWVGSCVPRPGAKWECSGKGRRGNAARTWAVEGEVLGGIGDIGMMDG